MASKGKGKGKRKSNTGKEYERIVASIYRQFSGDAIIKENEIINGRQIDVTIRNHVAGHECLIIVECKDYNRSVEVSKVDSIIGVMEDVRASLSVIVSDSGFTKGALERAQNNGRVKLVSVIDTLNSKLRSRITVPVQVQIHDLEPITLDLTFVSNENDVKELPLADFSTAVEQSVIDFVDWLNDNGTALPPGEHSHTRDFECCGCEFHLKGTINKNIKTFINTEMFAKGSAIFDHLMSKPLTDSKLTISIDVENDPSWQQVPNDYDLANCQDFFKRITKPDRDAFIALSEKLVNKWREA